MTFLRSTVVGASVFSMTFAAIFVVTPGDPRRAHENVARCTIPIAQPIVDGFRPPPVPWLSGNRGLTFAPVPGIAVRSVTQGDVLFAGSVGGTVAVSVRAKNDKRLTYSFLASTVVAEGQQIQTGQVIGYTGDQPFQLGLREGRRYFDPTPLVARQCGRPQVNLVPIPDAAK